MMDSDCRFGGHGFDSWNPVIPFAEETFLTVTVAGKYVDAGKTCTRFVYLFILCTSVMTKIEIEWKCSHGHSNHELNRNDVP
jgi:hypothetical protein